MLCILLQTIQHAKRIITERLSSSLFKSGWPLFNVVVDKIITKPRHCYNKCYANTKINAVNSRLSHCIETILSYSEGHITVGFESSTMKWETRTGEVFDTHPPPQTGQSVYRFSSNFVQTFFLAVACKRSISNKTNTILPPIWKIVPPKTLVPRIKL